MSLEALDVDDPARYDVREPEVVRGEYQGRQYVGWVYSNLCPRALQRFQPSSQAPEQLYTIIMINNTKVCRTAVPAIITNCSRE